MRNEVRKHGSAALVGRALSISTGMGMTLLLARCLGPEEFSYFAIFRTATTLLGVLSAFGLGTVSLRMLGEARGGRERGATLGILKKVSVVWICLASLLASMIGVATPFLSEFVFGTDRSAGLLLALAMAALGTGATQVIADAMRGLQRPEVSAIFGGLQGVPMASLLLLLGVTFWPDALPSGWLFWSTVYGGGIVCSALLALAILIAITRSANGGDQAEPGETSKSQRNDGRLIGAAIPSGGPSHAGMPEVSYTVIFAAAWPLAMSTVFTILSSQGDVFLTAWFAVVDEMPSYVVAKRWTLLVGMLLGALNVTASGLISGADEQADHKELQSFIRAGTTLIGMPSILLSALGFFAPVLALRLVFGPGYESAATILPILVLGQLAVVATGPCGMVLMMRGHGRIVFHIATAGFLLFAVLGPPIASKMGAVGLAWLVTSSLLSLNTATWVLCRQKTGLNTLIDISLCWKPLEFSRRLHFTRKAK